MTRKFLISEVIYETHKQRLGQVLTEYQLANNEQLDYLLLPSNGDRLPADVLDTIIAAYFSSDIREQELARPFFGSVRRAQNPPGPPGQYNHRRGARGTAAVAR